MNKPKVFLNVDSYLPGYKGGGPTQSIKNIVNSLSSEFDFYIFTSNHDFGMREAYNTVISDEWNVCFGAKIFYSSDKNRNRNLHKILKREKFSLIFLNSFFSFGTIKIISIIRYLKIKTPIVLMPRGELSEGALSIKRLKKMAYLKFFRTIKFIKNINYLATAQDEYEQIKDILKTDKVGLVSNIPNTEKTIVLNTKEVDKLKVVFLSRITSKKNLDYAIETLKKCHKTITFDIFGTMEDEIYWRKCEKIIESLPCNINVSYKGELTNEQVINTLANYDLLYFPTKSENYGHVISEALQASIPVLLSDTTPWNNLEEKKFGWIFKLSEQKSFAKKIDELACLKKEELNNIKKNIYNSFNVQILVDDVSEIYKSKLKDLIDND